MYNDMEVGSYLTWEGWPRHRVFQDPRINGYPPAFHAQLRRDDMSRAEWDALLAGFGVTTALLTYPDENPRAAYFDPERWALVYRAADGLVFVARRPEFAALTARAEIPVTFSFSRTAGVRARPLDAVPADRRWPIANGSGGWATSSSRPATTRARSLPTEAPRTPGCLDAAVLQAARMALGDAALRQHDPAAAAAAYAGIDLPRAHTNRALALLALDRPREAADEARRALALDANDADAQLADRLARERLARPGPPDGAAFSLGGRQR